MENLSKLLLPEIQEFIIKNTDQDAAKLSFAKNPFPEVDYKVLLNQIAARNKSKTKLPIIKNTEPICLVVLSKSASD